MINMFDQAWTRLGMDSYNLSGLTKTELEDKWMEGNNTDASCKQKTMNDTITALGKSYKIIKLLGHGNGTRNPSVNLLKRLAEGMDMALKIEFVPKQQV